MSHTRSGTNEHPVSIRVPKKFKGLVAPTTAAPVASLLPHGAPSISPFLPPILGPPPPSLPTQQHPAAATTTTRGGGLFPGKSGTTKGKMEVTSWSSLIPEQFRKDGVISVGNKMNFDPINSCITSQLFVTNGPTTVSDAQARNPRSEFVSELLRSSAETEIERRVVRQRPKGVTNAIEKAPPGNEAYRIVVQQIHENCMTELSSKHHSSQGPTSLPPSNKTGTKRANERVALSIQLSKTPDITHASVNAHASKNSGEGRSKSVSPHRMPRGRSNVDSSGRRSASPLTDDDGEDDIDSMRHHHTTTNDASQCDIDQFSRSLTYKQEFEAFVSGQKAKTIPAMVLKSFRHLMYTQSPLVAALRLVPLSIVERGVLEVQHNGLLRLKDFRMLVHSIILEGFKTEAGLAERLQKILEVKGSSNVVHQQQQQGVENNQTKPVVQPHPILGQILPRIATFKPGVMKLNPVVRDKQQQQQQHPNNKFPDPIAPDTELLNSFGVRLSEADMSNLFCYFDTDTDHDLDYKELCCGFVMILSNDGALLPMIHRCVSMVNPRSQRDTRLVQMTRFELVLMSEVMLDFFHQRVLEAKRVARDAKYALKPPRRSLVSQVTTSKSNDDHVAIPPWIPPNPQLKAQLQKELVKCHAQFKELEAQEKKMQSDLDVLLNQFNCDRSGSIGFDIVRDFVLSHPALKGAVGIMRCPQEQELYDSFLSEFLRNCDADESAVSFTVMQRIAAANVSPLGKSNSVVSEKGKETPLEGPPAPDEYQLVDDPSVALPSAMSGSDFEGLDAKVRHLRSLKSSAKLIVLNKSKREAALNTTEVKEFGEPEYYTLKGVLYRKVKGEEPTHFWVDGMPSSIRYGHNTTLALNVKPSMGANGSSSVSAINNDGVSPTLSSQFQNSMFE